MDARCFDQIVRALAAHGPRRGVLRTLVAFPLAGSLTTLPTGQRAADARRKKKKKCKKSRLCAGLCGPIKKKKCKEVDCGPCPCPPCPPCQTCDAQTGACVVTAAAGTACGQPGQVCQADGSCACVRDCIGKACGDDGCGGSCGECAACQTCNTQGTCEPQADGTVCGTYESGADDFLRCCNGSCPDPDCVPSGFVPSVPCGGDPECAGIVCCSQKTAQCSSPCFCLFSDAGETCVSDHDCNDPLVHPERRFCICGVCVIP